MSKGILPAFEVGIELCRLIFILAYDFFSDDEFLALLMLNDTASTKEFVLID